MLRWEGCRMGITEQGILGEQMAFQFCFSRGLKCLQSDLLYENRDGEYVMLEVKHQEPFKAPPFDGHGLPPQQVQKRLDIFKKHGIRCVFVVFDKEEHAIYYQWLDTLDAGKKAPTPTGSRVIYPLEAFIKADGYDECYRKAVTACNRIGA